MLRVQTLKVKEAMAFDEINEALLCALEAARERSEVLRGRACALHGFIPRNPACACGLQKVRNLLYLLLGSFDFVSLKRERR